MKSTTDTATEADSAPLLLEPATRSVLRDGRRIALGGRAYDLLAVMAARPGQVYSSEALLRAVWPGRVVEENNLRVQISVLRRAVGPQVMINVPGRGYLLGATVLQARGVRRSSRLPEWREPLLGRETELARLAALLAPGRVVSVVGGPGMGKTRLAAEAAQQQHSRHADGAYWVDLAAVEETADLAPAVAQALQLQTGTLADEHAGARLGAALAGRDCLLVFDNAERLTPELATLVAALLATAPQVAVLVTAQQRLQLPGEKVLRLGPLAVPAVDPGSDLAGTNPALSLLERHAQQADPNYTLAAADLAGAVQLCRQLEGVPLSLALAGAALPVIGLAEVLRTMAAPSRRAGLRRGSPAARHATLQAALARSHELLSPSEQAVLRRLAVFASAFRLHVAQQVAALDDIAPAAALRAVLALAEKSLLQEQSGEPPRFRLLESTRAFAREALAGSGETAAAEQRHARALARLAEQAHTAFWILPDRAWLAQWRPDADDLLLACDRACQAGDAESAAALGEALAFLAAATGSYGPLRRRLPAMLALLPAAAPRVQARLLDRVGVAAVPGLPRLEGARRRVQAWRDVGSDEPSLCRALAHLALVCEWAGDSAAADAACAEALALDRPDWPARQRAYGAALVQPRLAARRNDAAGLRDSSLGWQALCRAAGAWRLAALASCDLGTAEQVAGRAAAAAQHMEGAAADLLEQGLGVDAGIALSLLAGAWLDAGDLPRSRDAALHALQLLEGDPDGLRFGLEALALLTLRLDPQAHAADAARLLAASEVLRLRTALPRNPMNQRMAQQAGLVLAASLDAAACARLQLEGAALDAAAARRLALQALLASARHDGAGRVELA